MNDETKGGGGWQDLGPDLKELFEPLANCYDAESDYRAAWKFSDPHPLADIFLSSDDEGRAMMRAAVQGRELRLAAKQAVKRRSRIAALSYAERKRASKRIDNMSPSQLEKTRRAKREYARRTRAMKKEAS